MNLSQVFKVVGIVDGAVVAALTTVALAEPSWTHVLSVAAVVAGAAGTVLAALAGALAPSSSS